jgi:type I restriction enzyme M protein
MGADEFRDYILGFIFYKYLSERLNIYADKALSQDGITFTDIDETSDDGKEMLEALQDAATEALGYFLKPSELFHVLAERSRHGDFILPQLTQILSNVERSTMGTESEDDFDHLFEDLDLTSTKLGRTEEAKNSLISKVLTHLDGIDFRLEDANSDVLGDAYEYLIGMFASGAGKKAGEFYTPQSVSTILARIVTTGKTRLKSVYDPTCGSGSLLLRVAREVGEVSDFYGQEMNRTTYNLARMNMILHGVHYRNFDLRQDDTLENPMHEGMQFEAIVANPPFSAKWSAKKMFEQDERFSPYGRLAPASKADYAFITHMVHHLDDKGTMALVVPHGVLFRGAAEGVIREFLIKEKNWLDAVIGLPANIFYGTSIPTCILVFKKCRETEDILFIDASGEFEKGKNTNTLTEGNIDRIVDAYQDRTTVARFSYRAPLSEVAENEYNLNIPRYVDTFVEEKPVDLDAVTAELQALEAKMAKTDAEIAGFCKELGIASPFKVAS